MSVYEYHYCDLDPEKKGCRPGSRKECEHLKCLAIKSSQGINCPHFMYRKEKE